MKKSILFAVAIFMIGGTISVSSVSAVESAVYKKADTYKRVWHDGYWWIQVYNDNGDFVNEYIDPIQY